jgi:protoheme IX farnesyltransferase
LGFSKSILFSGLCLMLAIGVLYGRASNAFNQVIEKDLDALMDRTKTVLPTGRMSTFQHGCCERTYYSRDYFVVHD